MPQYCAAVFSEPLRKALRKHENALMPLEVKEVGGLINHLSLFHIDGLPTHTVGQNQNSLLAVAYNIITRGIPTLASPRTERLLSVLDFTKLEAREGQISHDWKNDEIAQVQTDAIIQVLHLVLPQAQAEAFLISQRNLESEFERTFIDNYIPDEHAYMRQLFARQRPRNTLGAPAGNEGRVDFSVEIPYTYTRATENRYHEVVEVRYHQHFVVEVDGARYHNDELDNFKDLAIGGLNKNINHIRERTASADARVFLNRFGENSFVARIRSNYLGESNLKPAHYLFALVPTAMARVQVALLEWFQSLHLQRDEYRVAVIERDVPGTLWAVEELLEILNHLNSLSETPYQIPAISLEVFTNEWLGRQISESGKPISDFQDNGYDLVIDLSVLQRKDVFATVVTAKNLVTIRSAHYAEPVLNNCIRNAPPVYYKSPIPFGPNKVNDSQKEVVVSLTYFLGLLFRKTEFREGQLPILARALQRKSVIGLLPTGGGKSLTFQLAAILQPGITLVVDPIRSLMVDQHRGLDALGITKSLYINSVLSAEEKRQNQEAMTLGHAQFVFISPERMVIEEFRQALGQANANGFHFAYCVIDEVHCLSEWGHDFRTPYLNLGDNAKQFCHSGDDSPLPLFGLTATASFDVLADIERELQIDREDGHAVVRHENTVRNEIFFRVEEVAAEINPDSFYTDRQLRNLIAGAKRSALSWAVTNKSALLSTVNDQIILRQILQKAYEEYVPDLGKSPEVAQYVGEQTRKLFFDEGIQLVKDAHGKYDHGIIVFAPHREGDYGVYDLYTDERANWSANNSTGYFMGSGDDDLKKANAIDHTAQSMKHMDSFLQNEASLMFATKAFGMGIDKPDVRLTFHLNISSSIESFVQETGRAARDGKVSLSTIYFNNQQFSRLGDTDRYQLSTSGYFLPDWEVLNFFHRLSFEGRVKEAVILQELLTSILFPRTTVLEKAAKALRNEYNLPTLKLKFYSGNGNRRIYVTAEGEDQGYIALLENGVYVYDTRNERAQAMLDAFKATLKQIPAENVEALWTQLHKIVPGDSPSEGVETKLKSAHIGEKLSIIIPFTNIFYPAVDRDTQARIISDDLKVRLMQCAIVKKLHDENIYERAAFEIRIDAALKANQPYYEFVESFTKQTGGIRERLHKEEELERVYSLPRNERNTAKAIYRLTTLGIVDSYTIDYQNKCFTVYCIKKQSDHFFKALEALMARYSSSSTAKSDIRKFKKEFSTQAKESSEMQFCLNKLTHFVYGKIEEKRKLAMSDIVRLCQRAIGEKDPIKQSEAIKSEIFYYFNAKYARENNEVVLQDDEGHEQRVPGCLPAEREGKKSVIQVVTKFISFVELDTTGAFRNNLKHLRGAAQRTITSYPDFAPPYFLRAYCLLIQSEDVPALLDDAENDLTAGLEKITGFINEEQIINILSKLKAAVKKHHSSDSIDDLFDALEDQYYIRYHTTWIRNFSQTFITDTYNAITKRT